METTHFATRRGGMDKDRLKYALACLQQGMGYQAAAAATGVNVASLRDALPGYGRGRIPNPVVIEDENEVFEECAALLPDASARDCRKVAALALALLCEKAGPAATQAAMVNIAAALPAVRVARASEPILEIAAPRVSGREVIEYVAGRFGLTFSDMLSVRRTRQLARPRQIAMYVLHHVCPHLSYPKIGKLMGGRDHSTIIWGIRKVETMIAADPDFAKTVAAVLGHYVEKSHIGGSPFLEALRFRPLCDRYAIAMGAA